MTEPPKNRPEAEIERRAERAGDQQRLFHYEAEIDRLRAERDVHAAEECEMRERCDELLAELKSCLCPGGGWNGMPKDMEATVQACMTHGVCGCTLGAAVAKAEGRP
jgi:hypothetical protein